ncbi:MAG: hypothetical protein GQ532_16420 [Methylomarinum sp.]|nr:hypothetical protein [Methylomarinum sp.]
MKTENTRNVQGIPPGYKYPKTVRKQAIKRLRDIVFDENAEEVAVAIAATKLLEEIPA